MAMTGSSNAAVMLSNPFVGPRPIDTGQKIFGRDHEIEELYYLLSAERIVLLHSPSGAGKSSLIQAGLVPRLSELFDVWGPTRVNLQPPEGDDLASVNRYVQSANLGFEARIPKERQRLQDLISAMTLCEYVASRPRRRSAPPNIVLIFDQFEEILTVDSLALQAKQKFFDQLGKLLQDPHIWALFALREDYLAPLDPYAELVPTHLKNRFRLDLLARDAASEAISKSVEAGGRHFAPDAVEKLVNDLATMQVQRPDGTFQSQTGPFVEPLYLQVACRGLWERMPEAKLTIDLDDIQSFGHVTRALAEYYEREVAGIANREPRLERAIRAWMGEALITPDGIRGQILKGAGQSDGLDNRLIAQLVNAHLVRAEQRAGAVWYELSHDRLIEPVRTSNKVWFEAHLSKLQKVAKVWEAQGRPEGLLLLSADLVEARQWAADNESSLTGTERKFLEASDAKQAAIRREKRLKGRLLLALGIATALALAASFASRVAFKARNDALFNAKQAKDAAGEATREKTEAERQKAEAEKQKTIANSKTIEARQQAETAKHHRMVNAWQSAARQAVNDLANHRDDDRSALLAVQSLLLHKSTPDEAGTLIEQALQSGRGQTEFAHVFYDFQHPVSSVAFSPDGTRLAAVSGGHIRMWDLSTKTHSPTALVVRGSEFAFAPQGNRGASIDGHTLLLWDLQQSNPQAVSLPGHPSSSSPLVFSADGNRLAASGDNKAVLLWDLQQPTRQPIEIPGHQVQAVSSMAFSPDGNSLAALSNDKTVLLWDLQQPNPKPIELPGHQTQVAYSVMFSLDGNSLVSAGDKVLLWDLRRPNTLPRELPVDHQGPVYSIAFAPDGGHLAGACYGGTVLWSLSGPYAQTKLSSGTARQVAFSQSGSQLASANADGLVRVWGSRNPAAPPSVFPGHDGNVWSVAFSPQGNLMASGGEDNSIRVWDLHRATTPWRTLSEGRRPVNSVAFSPTGKRLASAGDDKIVRVWDLEQPLPLFELTGSQGSLRSVAFSSRGTRVASGGDDKTLRVWDLQRPKKAPIELLGHQGRIGSVAFSPDGHHLASASEDRSVRIWDLERPIKPVLVFSGEYEFSLVAFSPDGTRVESAGLRGGPVFVWDLREPRKPPLRLSDLGIRGADSVAFSPNGDRIAVGDPEAVRIWDLHTNQGPLILTSRNTPIGSVAFSLDGNLLATGGAVGTTRVWDLWQSHRPLLEISGGPYSVVAFSPNGDFLAVGNEGGTVGLWPLWDKAADYLCTVVWRNLSWDEWQSYIGKDIPYERTCKNLPDGQGVPSKQGPNKAPSSKPAQH
jgi:WD40 repeat protein